MKGEEGGGRAERIRLVAMSSFGYGHFPLLENKLLLPSLKISVKKRMEGKWRSGYIAGSSEKIPTPNAYVVEKASPAVDV